MDCWLGRQIVGGRKNWTSVWAAQLLLIIFEGMQNSWDREWGPDLKSHSGASLFPGLVMPVESTVSVNMFLSKPTRIGKHPKTMSVKLHQDQGDMTWKRRQSKRDIRSIISSSFLLEGCGFLGGSPVHEKCNGFHTSTFRRARPFKRKKEGIIHWLLDQYNSILQPYCNFNNSDCCMGCSARQAQPGNASYCHPYEKYCSLPVIMFRMRRGRFSATVCTAQVFLQHTQGLGWPPKHGLTSRGSHQESYPRIVFQGRGDMNMTRRWGKWEIWKYDLLCFPFGGVWPPWRWV